MTGIEQATRLLGDYHLLKPIGRGSLGSSYVAEHRLMKRRSLLKILPPELSSDERFIRRFETEIVRLSRLDHPHLVKIDHVSHAEGIYFLVADFLEDAMNLHQFLRRDKVSEELVFSIAQQLASALDYAHERGMAHGGIKGNNLLLRTLPDGIHVSLSDFGLSWIIGPAAVLGRIYQAVCDDLSPVGFASSRYTEGELDPHAIDLLHDSFLQAYPFLSPELKRKKGEGIDPIAADQYAFGVLLYFLLKGEYPEGYGPLACLPSDLKKNWEPLLVRCLHADPAQRPTLLSPLLETLDCQPDLSQAKQLLKKLQARPVLKPTEIARPSFEPDPGAIFQVETLVGRYQPEMQEEKSIEPLLTPMQVIPAGTYSRGSNLGCRDELPRHMVNLSAFALDIHAVTNEQFVRFLEAMGGEKDVNNNDIIRLRDSRIKRSGGKLNIESGYAKHPVVGVTWYGAVAYAKWIGKRLPTEAEWEIAALGGQADHLYPTGGDIERSQANFFSADTTPVMSYPPNDYGLHDMAGNVYEWCQDWYDYHYYDHSIQEPDNPKGPLQGVYRVLRGGCWKSLKEDLRCAHRHRNNPGAMNGTYGFRCAADVSEDE